MQPPRSYNDNLLDERRRAVFYKAMTMAERMIESPEFDADRVAALAALADAAGNEFVAEADEGPDDRGF